MSATVILLPFAAVILLAIVSKQYFVSHEKGSGL
jgi:hypothetical protein